MKAIAALPPSDPRRFAQIDVPEPTLRPRDVLVRVHAVSVNPVDLKVHAATTEPRVLGWDVAGEVVAVGSAAYRFRVGDRVWYAGDSSRAGANSQWHAVDERVVARMPATLSYEAAAALPLTALTAWEALFERLEVQQAEGTRTILIVGGAGGVGSIAIQLARRAGLHVIATASRAESAAWCRELGAHRVIDHTQDLVALWPRLELPAPDYILCAAETDPWFDTLAQLVAPHGRIGLLASAHRPLDIQPLMRTSASIVWENVFTKVRLGTSDLESQARILEQVADLVDDGALRTTHAQTAGVLSAGTLGAAHAQLAEGRTIGKIVLSGMPVQVEQRRAA